MLLNKMKTSSIKDATDEIAIRKKEYSDFVHYAKYNDGYIYIYSQSVDDYINEKMYNLLNKKKRF